MKVAQKSENHFIDNPSVINCRRRSIFYFDPTVYFD